VANSHEINLKGLSPEQVNNLLPEGLISLCWRGSVAHGMYVPKSDPDSIDDKDVMGVYIGSIEHYLGFGRNDVYEQWEGEWDCVFYELILLLGRYSIAMREKHRELISQREALHKKSDTTLLKQVVSHDQLTSGTLARH